MTIIAANGASGYSLVKSLRKMLPQRFAISCVGFLLLSGVGVLTSCSKEKAPKDRVVEIAEEETIVEAQHAQETPIDPAIPELKINKSAQVAILCYHDFVEQSAETEMRIHINHFRNQMQAIKDAKLSVISLTDFLKWRAGEADIPDPSVMITIDDGYRSVHDLALPVLKEFGYPFSVFLYKNYVNGGGRALTTEMIKKLMANGCEIGSHSVSHPFNIARTDGRSPEEYEKYLVTELNESKVFLEEMFMVPVKTYAHPGGVYTQRVLELGTQFGYEIMFSVNPAKATWDSPAGIIPRYVVLGNDAQDRNFRAALSFRGISAGDLGKQLLGGEGGETLVTTYPRSNQTIAERRPLISVDVSKLEGVDPASVSMKIAGFGVVPCQFDPATGRITYHVVEPLRSNEVHVHVSFHRKGEPKPDMVTWKFFIDLVAHYLPDPPPTVEAPKAVPVDMEPASHAPGENSGAGP